MQISIVLRSRNKVFYTDLKVPDTIDGRFHSNCITLFSYIVFFLKKRSLIEQQVYDDVVDIMYIRILTLI